MSDDIIGEYVWCLVCRTFLGFKSTGAPEPQSCPAGCTVTFRKPRRTGVLRNLNPVDPEDPK